MNRVITTNSMGFYKRDNHSYLLQLNIAQFVVSKVGQNGTN